METSGVPGVILGKEVLVSLDIFGSFPSKSRVADPADLVFEGSRGGMPRVENFCNLVLFLAFDNDGGWSAKLGL